jgi:hypothetical protein
MRSMGGGRSDIEGQSLQVRSRLGGIGEGGFVGWKEVKTTGRADVQEIRFQYKRARKRCVWVRWIQYADGMESAMNPPPAVEV